MKKRHLLNISVLGLLILLGVFMGIAAMTLNSQSFWSKTANKDNTAPSNANWTKGGISSNFTFTVNMTGFDNITEVNFVIPSVFKIPNTNSQKANKHYGIYNGSDNFTHFLPGKGVRSSGGWNITLNGSNAIVNFTQQNGTATNFSDDRYTFHFNLTSSSPGTENTVNFTVYLRARDSGKSVSAAYDFGVTGGIDDLKPRLVNINVSDGTHVLRDDMATTHPRSLNGSGWVKNASNIVVTAEILEYNRRRSIVYLFWNSSLQARVPTSLTNGWYKRSSAIPNARARDGAGGVMNMTTTCKASDTGTQRCIYTATIQAGNFTDKNVTSLVIFMNDTFNHVSIWNNSDRGYNFTVDGVEPTTTITMPADTLINVQRSITIKCVAGDDGSGADIPTITITGPAGDTVTKTVDVSTNEATFSASEVGRAGKYDVKCEAVDNVGKSGSSSITDAFKVLSQTLGDGGVGVGAGEAAKAFDIDLSKEDSKIIKRSKGASVTLTFDGATEHKITWDDVKTTSAKFTISSDPVTITINKGDTKKVDINRDGIDDLSVKLREIDGDQAEILVSKLEGAAVIVEEEKEAAAEEGEVTPTVTEQKEAASKTTLWITILVVIVIVIALVIILKSRGKKGQVKFTSKDLGY